jgi:hypothetical protein
VIGKLFYSPRGVFVHSTFVPLSSRVTRLGEFSPIGQPFTLGGFLKIAQVAKIFGLLFPTVKVINAF